MTERKKARRGKGEGNVQKRPDGSWQGQLSAGKNADGSRRRIFVNAPTKHECLDELSKARGAFRQGTLVSPDAVTVEGFLVRWIKSLAKAAGSTIDSYQRNINKWIVPIVGQIKLQKLDAMHVQDVIDAIKKADNSDRLAQYNRTILRKALKDAVRWGLVQRNVTDLVDAPSGEPPEIVTWDEVQTNKAIKECYNERLGAITAIGLLCGLRQGEILALQWPDIDLKKKRITVRRTQSTQGGQVILKKPKTKSGSRTVDFSETLAARLHEHRAAMLREGWLNQPFVFVDTEGKMLGRFGDARSHFLRIIRATKNPMIGFHCTRHTHATLLLKADVNPKIVQERLGHSTVTITLELYSHVMPAMQKSAVDKLDRLLG